MTEQQAIEIMQKAYPEFILQTVTDYENYFVFTMQPKDAPEGAMWIDDPTAVDKMTGKTVSFHPLHHSPKDYFKAVREKGHSIEKTRYDKKVEAGKDAIAHALLKN